MAASVPGRGTRWSPGPFLSPMPQPSGDPAALVAWIERLRRQRWTAADIAQRQQLGRATAIAARFGAAPLARSPRGVRAMNGRIPAICCMSTLRDSAGLGAWAIAVPAIGAATCGGSGIRPRGNRCSSGRERRADGDDVLLARPGVVPPPRHSGASPDDPYNVFVYRSSVHGAVRALRVRPLRTRPYTSRTNGKAERSIQTLLREWAYRRPFATSPVRTRARGGWRHYYNWHRRHSSLHDEPPVSRLRAANLVRLHI